MTKFLNNKDGEHLKAFLLDKIEAVVSYPRDYFEGFSITTVIVILSKQASEDIKFLNILEPDLLENPADIQRILQHDTTTIGTNYTLRVADRAIDLSANWKLYLTDPEDKFEKLQTLDFLESLDTFFGTIQRGGAENSGGSKIIYPDFNNSPFKELEEEFVSFGIKGSRHSRNYILTENDLNIEKAIHFPDRYDADFDNGLHSSYDTKTGLYVVFEHGNTNTSWQKIVNAAYRNQIEFDILIPRAQRAKHSCYFNPLNEKIVLSTNFFYLSGFQNGNTDSSVSEELQKKFITAYLLSSFGQIQHEINSNNQEGLRKMEGFHIVQFKVPDIRQLTPNEIQTVTNAFDALNASQATFKGDEGINTPRKDLDLAIGQIIFERNNLGFDNLEQLVQFFQLFLAELVDERNPSKW